MVFTLPVSQAKLMFPEYDFVSAFPPSAQKAAFHVVDTRGHHLCLKVIAPDYSLDRLEREVVALQSLRHPNVSKLVEYTFTTKGAQPRHYILEEFVDGGDLGESLQDGLSWGLDRTRRVFSRIASGLAAIHRLSIVHRDLKPSNIRLKPDDTPVIIDFGLARHLELASITKTEEGAALGTPTYFAPEQFSGTKRDIDHRTDLFAFGIMLYQALVGYHPFYQLGIDYSELMRRVLEDDTCLSQPGFVRLPGQWQLLCRKLLARDRVKRPVSAQQVLSVLDHLGEIA